MAAPMEVCGEGDQAMVEPATAATTFVLERARRIEAVHAWQRHYNMPPRHDSKLTQLFADGQVYMTADQVARELLATDYIYRTTLYGELIEDFLRGVAERLRATHAPLSWTATWTIVRFYGPIALKLMCLGATAGRIPDRMPDALVATPPAIATPSAVGVVVGPPRASNTSEA